LKRRAPVEPLTTPEREILGPLLRRSWVVVHLQSGHCLEDIAIVRASARRVVDRVLGSLHCLPLGQRFSDMPNLYRQRPAAEVVREYLTEIADDATAIGWGFAEAVAMLEAHGFRPGRHPYDVSIRSG
jgi:hypothetical protein